MNAILVGASIGVGLSILLYLYIGWEDHRRVKELRQYFFSGWELRETLVGVTIFSSSMSLATVVIALLQLGVIFGIGLSLATITFCLGWVLFLIAGPTIRSKALRRDTIHSFIGRSFGSRSVAVVASSATIIGFLGLFATELFAADTILKALGFGPSTTLPAVVLFGFATVVYAAVGGFRSVVRSDWSQTAFLLLALGVLVLLAILLWQHNGSPSILNSPQTHSFLLPSSVALSLFFINVPYPFVDTQAWQRVITANSDSDFRRGSVYAIVAFALTWTVLIAVAVILAPALQKGDDPFLAVVQHIAKLGPFSAFVVSLILFPGLLAAMFSSADGFINSAAHCFSLDLTSIRDADEASDVSRQAQLHVFGLGVLGLVLTITLREAGFGIVDMVFAVSAGQLALFPPAVAALFINNPALLHRLRPAALAAIVSGFAAAWINGFYSTLAPNSDWWLWKQLATFLPVDVYRSTIYAFLVSNAAFLLTGAIVLARPYVSQRRTQ